MVTVAVWVSRETSKDLTPVEIVSACARLCRGLYQRTIELLENTFNCAGAATAGHGDIELVCVVGHFGEL